MVVVGKSGGARLSSNVAHRNGMSYPAHIYQTSVITKLQAQQAHENNCTSKDAATVCFNVS